MTHTLKKIYDNETLLESEEMFGDAEELKFEILDKNISLDAGDFSDCPPAYLHRTKQLVEEFSDRFSKKKLDIEVTDMYEASLETQQGKKVVQKVRPLPPHKYDFALKAVRQLEDAGVVRESDSPWRSNVVMVPKPMGKNELRANTKADYQTGSQNTAQHFRICLDFRDLNNILEFPQQVAFPTIENFLHKMKGKYVVNMEISSSFYVIPIREEDRYKTAFWLNDLAFEFNVLVTGLKSSPYHLKKFMEKAYSNDAIEIYKNMMPEDERKSLPNTMEDILCNYFDDNYIIREDPKTLLACTRLCLLIARDARIKYLIEKSAFVTTKVKILGDEFDTMDAILTMDKLKASAIQNLKKPSSLFELHSRLASFQYNSVFIPYLKHIAYPLQFLLRKGEFKWGPIEEMSWQLLKAVSTLNLRLSIPEPDDILVLATDASKIAASACLFRDKNGKLELVATNSKYFSVTDLNKCSYLLESIALSFGLKSFASYILNCTSKVLIFTDAKSLIYAKRNSTHSILLNSTLRYLQTIPCRVNKVFNK
jgi:RNase H-like domain found in reverse transcriptase/Reverse transcriptase (RNA-dependent DNA polymerase)